MMASKNEFGWLAAINTGPFIFNKVGLLTISFLQYKRKAIFAGYFNKLNSNFIF